jgi:hypothetical protein
MVSEDDIRKLLKGELTEKEIEQLKVESMLSAIWSELAKNDSLIREMRKHGFTYFAFSRLADENVPEFAGHCVKDTSLGRRFLFRIFEHNNDAKTTLRIKLEEEGKTRRIVVSMK